MKQIKRVALYPPDIAGVNSAAVTSTCSCRDADFSADCLVLSLSRLFDRLLVTRNILPLEGSTFHTSARDAEITESSAAWEEPHNECQNESVSDLRREIKISSPNDEPKQTSKAGIGP